MQRALKTQINGGTIFFSRLSVVTSIVRRTMIARASFTEEMDSSVAMSVLISLATRTTRALIRPTSARRCATTTLRAPQTSTVASVVIACTTGMCASTTSSIAMTTVRIKENTRVQERNSAVSSNPSGTRFASTRDFRVRRRRPSVRPGLSARNAFRILTEYAVMRCVARTRPQERSSGSVAWCAD